MSYIEKAPRGLISLLSLRTDGRPPSQLADVVAPSIDLRELFLLDTRETLVMNTITAPAVGSNFPPATAGTSSEQQGRVPAGELWYCWHYGAILNCGVGTAIDACLAMNPEGMVSAMPLGNYVSVGASQERRPRAESDGFWAGPGTLFCALVNSVTGAPTITPLLVFTRMRV